MKYLLLITACLCLIAAITPATAWSNMAVGAFESGNASANGAGMLNAVDNNSASSWTAGTYPVVTGIEPYSNHWIKIYSVSPSSKIRLRAVNGNGANVSYWVKPSSGSGSWCNTTHSGSDVYDEFNIATGGSGTYLTIYPATASQWAGLTDIQEDGVPQTITANFNATPVSGQAPLYVAFQDTSTGYYGVPSYNWSVSPDTGVIGEESTSAYPTMAFTLNGNYSVTHCIADAVHSDCETKTDYISVYNSTATTTTTFWAVDPLGHRVWDSAISLQDVGNSSWTNTSSPSGGVATITSLIGHIINGYATASGYNDGETLGIPADGVSGGIILMTPTNITNVSAGYVTLYVYVKESVGNAPISGAYVNLAYAEGGSTRNDGGTTSSEGLTSFVVPNNTLVYVYGEKAGYERVSTTKDSGSASGGSASVSVILYMGSQTVTPKVTATTGPGGTVPVTVDPRTPAEKEADIANILIDYGDMLVLFFIALTVIGGVKMIAK